MPRSWNVCTSRCGRRSRRPATGTARRREKRIGHVALSVLRRRLAIELLDGLQLDTVDPEVLEVEIGAFDPLRQAAKTQALGRRESDRRLGRQVADVDLGDDQILPGRHLESGVARTHPAPVEDDPRTLPGERGERIGIKHVVLLHAAAGALVHRLDRIPVEPAMEVLVELHLPDAGGAMKAAPPGQRIGRGRLAVRLVGAGVERDRLARGAKSLKNVARPETIAPRARSVPRSKKNSPGTSGREPWEAPAPAATVHAGQVERPAERKPPEVGLARTRIDEPVDVARLVADTVGGIVRGSTEVRLVTNLKRRSSPLATRSDAPAQSSTFSPPRCAGLSCQSSSPTAACQPLKAPAT